MEIEGNFTNVLVQKSWCLMVHFGNKGENQERVVVTRKHLFITRPGRVPKHLFFFFFLPNSISASFPEMRVQEICEGMGHPW